MTVQRSYFTVLFFVKKSKPLKNGEVPICMRITVNGKRAEVQIRRSVEAECWNAQKECAIGKDRKHMELNHYLETVRTRVLQIHRELEQDGKPVTAEILKRNYSGGSDSPRMLVETFNEHNKQYRELMGRDYVKGTVLRYERTAAVTHRMLSAWGFLGADGLIENFRNVLVDTSVDDETVREETARIVYAAECLIEEAKALIKNEDLRINDAK